MNIEIHTEVWWECPLCFYRVPDAIMKTIKYEPTCRCQLVSWGAYVPIEINSYNSQEEVSHG